MVKINRQKLKPTLTEIKNSRMIYMGTCDGASEVLQRIAPDVWKRRGYNQIMNDHEVQNHIFWEMKRSLAWYKQGERVNLDVVWNDKGKEIAVFF